MPATSTPSPAEQGSRPLRIGIFAKLLGAFLLVSLLPLLAYWWMQSNQLASAEAKRAETTLQMLSNRLVQHVDDWVTLNLRVLQTAAAVPGMSSLEAAEQQPIVASVAASLPWAYLIHTLDASGMNIVRSDELPLTLYDFRNYYREVMAGALFSAEIQVGITSGLPAFLLSVPIHDEDGSVVGVLAEAATLDEVTQAVTAARFGESGFAFLTTPQGRLIAHPGEPLAKELVDYSGHPALRTALSQPGEVIRFSHRGKERLAAVGRTRLGWIAVVQQDAAESLAGVHRANRTGAALLGLTTLAVILLSLFVARGFAQPIEHVTALARQISRGRLTDMGETRRADQIGDLQRAMGSMSQTLTRFVDAQHELAHRHAAGQTDFRIDSQAFDGVFQDMTQALNEIVDEELGIIRLLLDVMDCYAVGDFSVELPELPGQRAELSHAMNTARENLLAIHDQIAGLVAAAARGDFSARGDPGEFRYAFREMVGDLNNLMDTTDRGLAEVARVLAAISRGDLNVTMSGEFEGTFAQLMRDANRTVAALAHSIEEIELHRALLSTTLENLPQGVCVVDAELRLLAWNRRYLEIFDFPEGFVSRGMPLEDLLRFNARRGLLGPGPDDVEVERRLMQIRRGREHLHERKLPDGTTLEIRGSPVPDTGYVTAFSDITEYKNTERALRALTDSLERRVVERTAALDSARAEAERANRAKSRFLAAAVHDLTQPISAARMYVSLLKNRLARDPAGELADNADSALGSIESVFTGLMDLAHFESGRLKPKVSAIDLQEMFDTLAREFEMSAADRGLRLAFFAGNNRVRSDRVLLYRIIQNLLANALRYTRSGGVLVGVRRKGSTRRIEVWDTGPGIPPHRTEEIFDEFRRLDTEVADGEHGSGLGLAIVKNIAAALGHPIGVRSRPGRGSVFHVDVPLSDTAAPAPSVETPPASTESLRGRRGWCVDDHAAARQSTVTALIAWGCHAHAYATSAAALRAARKGPPPDFLLLDYRIDQLDGLQLLARLNEIWGMSVPALLITGEQIDTIPNGHVRVLHKPLAADRLLEEILALLGGAH